MRKKIFRAALFAVLLFGAFSFNMDVAQADCTLTNNEPNGQCKYSETKGYFCGDEVTSKNCKKPAESEID